MEALALPRPPSSGNRRRRSTVAVAELLEPRHLLSGMIGSIDTNDQTNQAIFVGALTSVRTRSASLTTPNDVDLFSFTVRRDQRVAFDIDDTTVNTRLRLFSAAGTQLAASNNAAAFGETLGVDPFREYHFAVPGTYYLGVSTATNSAYDPIGGGGDNASINETGSYTLRVTASLGTNVAIGLTGRIDIVRHMPKADARFSAQVDPGEPGPVWVIVHGRTSSRHDPMMRDLADAVLKTSGNQVLTVDWSPDAARFGTEGESYITDVGAWVGQALTEYGFAASNLNFIAHSWGTYVSYHAALAAGGINTIVALDPATDVPGPYNPHEVVNFAAVTRFSWAFHSSVLGSNVTPGTADEAMAVLIEDVFPGDELRKHNAPVILFGNMLDRNDVVSRRFSLDRLLSRASGPWLRDKYTDFGLSFGLGLKYEAVLRTVQLGEEPLYLNYFSRSTGAELRERGGSVGISVTVYNDANSNGVLDTGEKPIDGFTTYLDLNNNLVLDTAEPSRVLDAQGTAFFHGLPSGRNQVRLAPRLLWRQTGEPRVVTSVPGLDDVLVTSGNLVTTSDGSLSHISFFVAFTSFPSVVGGVVYQDVNANGQRDTGEPPMQDVTLWLDRDGDGTRDDDEPTRISDANGEYAFEGLPPGTYTLRQVVPDGFRQTQPVSPAIGYTRTLEPGEAITWQFGNTTRVSVSGTLFRDNDGDGLRRRNEKGLTNWRIYTDSNGNGAWDRLDEAATMTDAEGNWSFGNLPAGIHLIRVVGQRHWTATAPRGDGSHRVTLAAGGTAADLLFGQTRGKFATALFAGNDQGAGFVRPIKRSSAFVFSSVDQIIQPGADPGGDDAWVGIRSDVGQPRTIRTASPHG